MRFGVCRSFRFSVCRICLFFCVFAVFFGDCEAHHVLPGLCFVFLMGFGERRTRGDICSV